MQLNTQKTAVAWLSVFSNAALVLAKLVIGLLIGSVSVISEAIHSGVDLLAAIIALFAVTQSRKPADKEHPFGHGKFENISGTIEAALIFLAAAWIVYEAVQKFAHPQRLEAPGWGVAIMLVSTIANLGVSHLLFQVARKTDSVALEADAWHLRTDVYTSGGVMAGLFLVWIGTKLFPSLDLGWVDPAAAIGVALLIVKAAHDLTVKAGRDLFDVSLPEHELSEIHAYLKSLDARVAGYHDLRTRKSGAHRFIEMHLMVAPDMSVRESHDITDEISDELIKKFPGATVTVHVEPCEDFCSKECQIGCFMNKSQP